jgi:hypothetical protein
VAVVSILFLIAVAVAVSVTPNALDFVVVLRVSNACVALPPAVFALVLILYRLLSINIH